jgi:hypothetical protein
MRGQIPARPDQRRDYFFVFFFAVSAGAGASGIKAAD